jgi:hypothetical protein
LLTLMMTGTFAAVRVVPQLAPGPAPAAADEHPTNRPAPLASSATPPATRPSARTTPDRQAPRAGRATASRSTV